jgi:DNA repair protein RecO (recombination protein O)
MRLPATVHPAFVLHTRPYRENSRIVELIVADRGRVTVMAHGRAALMRPFVRLEVSWTGRGELPQLKGSDETRSYRLVGRALVLGLYLNELVLRLFPRDWPVGEIFDWLERAYTGLLVAPHPEAPVRLAEWSLLTLLDSGLDQVGELDLQPEACFGYHPERGWRRMEARDRMEARLQGSTLVRLLADEWPAEAALDETRVFLQRLLHPHLGGRPLHTLQLL